MVSQNFHNRIIIILIIFIAVLTAPSILYRSDSTNDIEPTTPTLNSTTPSPVTVPINSLTPISGSKRLSTPTAASETASISTLTPTQTSITPAKSEDDRYEEFLDYLAGQFTATSTPLRIRGVNGFESNGTMWVVYNGTNAEDNSTARQLEWGELARSYGFALRDYKESNESGTIPILMKVVEANTSKNPEGTFTITSSFARMYAYDNISDGTYIQSWFQTLRNTTQQEQRIAQRIDDQKRNVTFYPNGTWRYTEPPKPQTPTETPTNDTTASVSKPDFRSKPAPVAARSVGR